MRWGCADRCRTGWELASAGNGNCVAVAVIGRSRRCGEAHRIVVGNSAYQNITRLDNPRNDATLMAETLSGLGFT